ncbi:hypothetical protein DY000_02007836 [Brassica cretica]|uniref:Uncharacterized protein n=1 Tax=Brassica cretica TaxID=69181 RepID=A0ABQ7CEY4_BRACR|nr:hypothetical protein DY000_02007836 [Brassica cretica]
MEGGGDHATNYFYSGQVRKDLKGMYKFPGLESQLAWGNAEQAAQLHHNPG